MSDDWTRLPQAEPVMRLESDPRPAWLWSGDGKPALWSNRAAKLFGAKLTATGLQLADDAQPVRGQISRILRLGLVGRTMLSRMHFLVGRKPLSATCQCTPLLLGDDKPYLLMVAVDPVDQAVLAAAAPADEAVDPEMPALGNGDTGDARIADEPVPEPHDGEGAIDHEAVGEDSGPQDRDIAPKEAAEPPEAEGERLTSLIDQLAVDEHLFAPLDEDDDAPLPAPMDGGVPQDGQAPVAEPGYSRRSDWDEGEHAGREEAVFAADGEQDQGAPRAGLWQVTGRGLALAPTAADDSEDQPQKEAQADPVDQVTRYNFEELSRILNDRVNRDEPVAEVQAAPVTPLRSNGALVALSEEALVLNRLPIGILIFRDQDILFVNRALVDLTGHESATSLRGLGLGAILPTIDASEPAGPVTHLIRKDGEKVSVSARLNSVTWQGRQSFMLTARTDAIEPLREAEVHHFAQLWARTSGQSFVTADRSGVVTSFAPATPGTARIAKGAPLTALLATSEHNALRNFLSLPSRYAGDVRPAIALKGSRAGETLTLFAEGRAGIVTAYFGLLSVAAPGVAAPAKSSLPTESLKKITRGLRRPLNTIAGFSELMVTEAFGPMGNARYLEYARDIRAAGSEIADLADELDDFVRIAEGELKLSPADVDIATLLAESLVRVRGQAGKARVLLRSAISERLPFVRVDAATLKQAVLNMLASAISDAGEGSRVVLSAQVDDDGAVSVHVRDAAKAPTMLAERFVVFRDGVAADGSERYPTQSSIGLTLTRSLVAVNACSLSLEPSSESGTLMTLTIPAALVVKG